MADAAAFRFVLTMGLVNLFADTTYEGGASLNGPFLGRLGADAAAVAIVAGAGEFLGYSLRSVSGWIADRTGRHWPITFVGYAINLLAVPAMSLAPSWQVAAALVLAERIGRAIRKPTVEAMLSYSTGRLYDRLGIRVVIAAVLVTALFPPLVFLGGFWVALVGLLLWGVGYATQDTLLKALIAGVLPEGRRNLAFGLFYIGYGGGWLAGSVTVGLLYGRSLAALVAFAVAAVLASVPLFVLAARTQVDVR